MTQPSSKRLVTEASLAPAITNAVAPIKNLSDPTLSAALSATFAADPDGYDIVILAGQSNMSGYSEPIPNAAVTDPPNPRIFQWGTHGTLGIKAATEPLDTPDVPGPTGLGPGLQFARWYVSRRPASKRKVLLVPTSQGGTPFEGASTPAGFAWKVSRSDVTNLYTNMITQANAAKAAADAIPGTTNRFIGLLWLQGETDGNNATTGPTYRTDLDALLTQARADLRAASLPIVIGTMVPEYLSTGTRAAINAVHRSTPYRITGSTVAIGATGANKGDGNHYSVAGQRFNGKAFADAYEALLQGIISGATDYTPGQAAAPTVSSGSTTALVVAWAAAANASSYIVEYRQTSVGGAWTTAATPTGTTATITGLTTSTQYDVRVTTQNIIGDQAAPSPVGTGTPAPPPAAILTDTFTRANSSTTLGTADTGQTWTAGPGTWGIQSNAAYAATGADGDRALIDTGVTDQRVTVTVSAGTSPSASPSPSVIARMTDANNGYVFAYQQTPTTRTARIFKFVGGVYTALGAAAYSPTVDLTDGQTIGLQVQGSTLTAFLNGAPVIALTDTTFTTGTKAGLRLGANSSAVRYDNFTVSPAY